MRRPPRAVPPAYFDRCVRWCDDPRPACGAVRAGPAEAAPLSAIRSTSAKIPGNRSDRPWRRCEKGGRAVLRQWAFASFIALAPSLASAQLAKFQIEEATIEDIQGAILKRELT